MIELSSILALNAAIELGRQGYAAFPCRADKRPSCEHGFHDATCDEAELAALWDRSPGPLVGVATGPASQIAVLDIDAKHIEARQWWHVHRPRLPATRTHRTRSGGLHLIFGDYDGLKCSAGKIARGIDVRADGGYIIWWPAAGCAVLSDVCCAPWPDLLIPEPPPPTRKTGGEKSPTGDLQPLLHRALGILRIMANAAEGERNHVLHWCGCRVREMVDAGELDQRAKAELIDSLREAARRVGLTQPEIARTLQSAMRAAA